MPSLIGRLLAHSNSSVIVALILIGVGGYGLFAGATALSRAGPGRSAQLPRNARRRGARPQPIAYSTDLGTGRKTLASIR